MPQLEILYNSECPICDREIEHYKKISSNDISYVPITTDTLNSWGLNEKQAAKKLHARLNGQQLVGVDAFLEIWTRLPYYRLLAKLVKTQPITFFANIIYSLILAPSLYKLHQVRQKKKLNSY